MVTIRDFRQGDVDIIVQMHAALYEQEYGMGGSFSEYVRKPMKGFENANDAAKERLWIAEVDGEVAGSVAIVCADWDGRAAQLRWFILRPEARGKGLGRELFEKAIDFCVQTGYRRVFLWTLSILEDALSIYKKRGFVLTESFPDDAWKEGLVQERYDLILSD